MAFIWDYKYQDQSDLFCHGPEQTRPILGDLFAVKAQRAQVLIHAALMRPVTGQLLLRVRRCLPELHDDPLQTIQSRYKSHYICRQSFLTIPALQSLMKAPEGLDLLDSLLI